MRLCHAVCSANPPLSWPCTFSVPLQPVSRASDLDGVLDPVQCAMSVVPLSWELAEGQSVDATAVLIHSELQWAMHASVSTLDAYISIMLDVFRGRLSGAAPRYVDLQTGC